MGSLFGKTKTETVQSTSSTSPWSEQIPYLKGTGSTPTSGVPGLFPEANRLYNSQINLGPYSGPRVAGFTGDTLAGMDVARGAANASAGISPAVMWSSLGGLGGLNRAATSVNALNTSLQGDPTSRIIGNAAQYANNPQIEGMIRAATRDDVRNFTENVRPGLNSMASATGNINSSRAAAAEAIARRGLEDRIADVSAGIRGDAYRTGLGMSQNQYNQDVSNRLGTAGTLANIWQSSLGGLGAASGLASDAANTLTGIGGAQQAQSQAEMDAARAKWQEGIDMPWQTLARLQGAVSGNYGGTTVSNTPMQTYQPGIGNYLMGALGAASTVAGLGGKAGFGWWGK